MRHLMSAMSPRSARSPFSARTSVAATTVLSAALLAACGTGPTGEFPRQFTNQPDRFEFETLIDVSGITRTETFTWTNSSTNATVTSTTDTDAGEARLVLRDGAGTLLFDQALTSSLDQVSADGVAGEWTIELVISDFSGDIAFVVESPAAPASAGS